MNVKSGELAIVVGGQWNVGRIVEIMFFDPGKFHHFSGVQGSWRVKSSNLLHAKGGWMKEVWFPDSWLRPLRDGEGDDESLSWAGKPEQVTA